MFLDNKTFSSIIQNTPLISIDLIVKNKQDQILLGKRVNKPAKDFWFVPGGRIFKDETLNDAFTRIVKEELGINLKKDDANFHGIYEHFYDDNVFNNEFSTHYIVLAHEIQIDDIIKTNNQHSQYKWFNKDNLLNDSNVHKYTKDYFKI